LASIGFSLGRTVWRGLVLAAIFAAPAYAETVSIACEANPALNAPAMTIVYEGEAEGTLTITAPFGEMSLPATKESREGTDEAGQPLSATGIRAAGPATVQMPDKAAIEACVMGKLPPDQLADSDIVFLTVLGCAGEAPVGTEPIAINASAEIALAPIVYVGITRTYTQPTDLAVGTIALEAYPNCSLEE
jgi:hypothetical protein